MRKYLLFCSIIIIICFSNIFICLNVVININKDRNNKVLDIFNSVWDSSIDVGFDGMDRLPKMEIDEVDYIGVIKIGDYEVLFPVESNCQILSSVCRYSSKKFIILGNNLKSSFYNYELYGVGDVVIFINTLGEEFRYRISKIDRVRKIEEISNDKDDLVVVVKNYYSMEYMFFRCKREC